MPNPRVVDEIVKAMRQGRSEQDLRAVFLGRGASPEAVNALFVEVNKVLHPAPVNPPRTFYESISDRDHFRGEVGGFFKTSFAINRFLLFVNTIIFFFATYLFLFLILDIGENYFTDLGLNLLLLEQNPLLFALPLITSIYAILCTYALGKLGTRSNGSYWLLVFTYLFEIPVLFGINYILQIFYGRYELDILGLDAIEIVKSFLNINALFIAQIIALLLHLFNYSRFDKESDNISEQTKMLFGFNFFFLLIATLLSGVFAVYTIFTEDFGMANAEKSSGIVLRLPADGTMDMHISKRIKTDALFVKNETIRITYAPDFFKKLQNPEKYGSKSLIMNIFVNEDFTIFNCEDHLDNTLDIAFTEKVEMPSVKGGEGCIVNYNSIDMIPKYQLFFQQKDGTIIYLTTTGFEKEELVQYGKKF
jgi:hypothetical protein